MRWRYTLIDRNNTRTGIDEPIGWDSFSIKLKRHPERHGTFRDVQANNFQFTGAARQLLQAEYEQYGIRGNYTLLIEEKCKAKYEQVYVGKIDFGTYDDSCGDQCYVTISCDMVGPLVDLINRFDQQVDISLLKAFDKATDLTDYATISQEVLLPSKALLLRSQASNGAASPEYIISQDSGWFPVAGTGLLQGGIAIPFDTVGVNAIKDFTAQTIIDYYNKSNFNEYIPEIIYNNPDQPLNCIATEYQVDFRVKGTYKNLVSGSGNQTLTLALKTGTTDFYSNATLVQGWTLYTSGSNIAGTHTFDVSYSGRITVRPGDKLWLNPFLSYFKATNYNADVRIQFDAETFFNASVISKCDPTTAKLFLINETTSRVIESITDNQLKLYSTLLGRTNSLPFNFPSNGCAALRAVTPGLNIRRAKMSDGSDPKLFLSLQDIFNALSAIDNIGIGPEDDDKLRLENWKFFYQQDVIITHRDIDLVEKMAQPSEMYSIFNSGYEKWEAEDYNGLDEFLTKRTYRTSLSELKNTLDKVCKWIASGYAWEVTRRKANDTKDWRFDNDTFITCLRTKVKGTVYFISDHRIHLYYVDVLVKVGDVIQFTGTVSNNRTVTVTNVLDVSTTGGHTVFDVAEVCVVEYVPDVAIFENLTHPFQVEIKNISDGANILDPDTVYNFRLSPERNAMRWFNTIAQAYRNITVDDKLIFSFGEGNFVAQGQLKDALCKLEAGVIKESDDISLSTFNDQHDGLPIAISERIKYTYPTSAEEYNLIQAKPYGLIAWESKCEKGQAWIDEIEWKPEEGIANYLLIPKINP